MVAEGENEGNENGSENGNEKAMGRQGDGNEKAMTQEDINTRFQWLHRTYEDKSSKWEGREHIN